MSNEENYDPVRVQRTIEGAYRAIDAVVDNAYEELEILSGVRESLEGHQQDVEEAIGMVEGLYSAVQEGDDLIYGEDDLVEATWGLNNLEEIHRSVNIPGQRPVGEEKAVKKVADTIRRLETTLEQDVLNPTRDYGKIEPLEPID